MLCTNCKTNEATCHFRQVINGKKTEMHLCEECAAAQGFDTIFSKPMGDFEDYFNSNFGLSGLLSHMLVLPSERRRVKTCPLCGATAEDIADTGRVGCAQCYETFSDILMPYIHRIHGNTSHVGRIPNGREAEISAKKKIEKLKKELKKAISDQRFEDAAQLRDQLKSLETEEQ